MHRGEGFYPREALAELHTADRCAIQEDLSVSLTTQHSSVHELRFLPKAAPA